MEKRALLAIALSVLVLFAFRLYVEKQMPPPKPQPQKTTSAPANPTGNTPNASPPAGAAEAAPMPMSAAGDTQAVPKRLTVEGTLYRATIDNRGGVLAGWELKQYKSMAGDAFEMIAPGNDPAVRAYPGSVQFDDAAATALAGNELYEIEVTEGENANGSIVPPATVALRLRRGTLSIEKQYRFEMSGYATQVSARFLKDGKRLSGKLLIAQDIGPEKEHLLNASMTLEAVSETGGKIQRQAPPKDPAAVEKVAGDIRWVGLDMQYFAIIAIPPRSFGEYEVQKNTVKVIGLEGSEVSRDLLRVSLPVDGSAQFGLFLGPKRKSDLESVNGVDLTGVVNYGMFSFLVRPLLAALKWLDSLVHNYGYAIILLTLLLTLALFPFRIKQMVSMKKMAVVQPKVKAIQEKYKKYKKTDPKRAEMNQEVMAIYREHGVNPLGGCLPLLLQMPLLYAFYSLLAYSIELRHAPFIGWIHDLSTKDPYYVLPIVMGISMLISQKMTPMSPGADPAQAKMMMMMPVVFTFLFLNVSSGLNLYFLFSNIFQIAFQKISERWIGDGNSRVKSEA
jgi:YidC/Oxa1 family membrane protein insertase